MATISQIPIASGLLKEEQLTFQQNIRAVIKLLDIPKDLALNSDQTPLSYITVANNTLEFEGTKSIPVKVKGEGKQITGTFAVSGTGQLLLIQLIYTGKNKRCHLQGIEFPSGFDVTHSFNHWSNKQLVIQHIREVILPYVDKIKEELSLTEDLKNLLIYDVFKGQPKKGYADFLLEKILHMFLQISLASVNLTASTSKEYQKVF